MAGKSIIMLGSEDPRSAAGLAIQFNAGKLNLLRVGNRDGFLVLEFNHYLSANPAAHGHTYRSSQAWGAVALSRYHWNGKYFAEFGLGVQVASTLTRDLDSRGNFTPTFGLGAKVGNNWLVGVRLLHISNAGLVGGNRGQNQLFAMLAVPL